MHSRECANEQVVTTIYGLEEKGWSQYQEFCKEVFIKRTKSIHDPLKLNKLHILKTTKPKINRKASQLASARNNANLFGQLYIANEQRGGNQAVFFFLRE